MFLAINLAILACVFKKTKVGIKPPTQKTEHKHLNSDQPSSHCDAVFNLTVWHLLSSHVSMFAYM